MRLMEVLSLASTLSKAPELVDIEKRAQQIKNKDEDTSYAQAIINLKNESDQKKPASSNAQGENIIEILTHCAQATINPTLWSDKLLAIGNSDKQHLYESKSFSEQQTYEKLISDAKKYIKEKKPVKSQQATQLSKTTTDQKNIASKATTASKQFQLPQTSVNINEILAKQKQIMQRTNISQPAEKKEVVNELLEKQRAITRKKDPISIPGAKTTHNPNELLSKQLEMEKKKNLTLELELKKSQEQLQAKESELKDSITKLLQGKTVAIDFHEKLKLKSKECNELSNALSQAEAKITELTAAKQNIPPADEKEQSIQEQFFLYLPEEDGNISNLELDKLLNQTYDKFADDIDFHILKAQTLKMLPNDQKAMKDFIERLYEEFKEINYEILLSQSTSDAKKAKLWQNPSPEAIKFIEMLDKDLSTRIKDTPPYKNEADRSANKICLSFFIRVRNRIMNLKENSELKQLSKHRHAKFIKRNIAIILRKAVEKYKEQVLAKIVQTSATKMSSNDSKDAKTLINTTSSSSSNTTSTASNLNFFTSNAQGGEAHTSRDDSKATEAQQSTLGYITSTAYSWLRWGKNQT